MPTPKKAAVIDELTEKLGRINAAALIDYRGLTVAEISVLRGQLRQRDAELQVTKNTLLREAARRSNMTDLDDLFVGPTATAFIYGEESAGTKALIDFFRTARVGEIKSGILKGGRKISAQDFAKLAELPNRQTLLAQIAGLLESPMAQIASLFNAPAQQFAYALAAFQEKGGAETAGAHAEATEAPSEPVQPPDTEPVASGAPRADASSAQESGGSAATAATDATEPEAGESPTAQEAAADASSAPESEGSADATP